MTTKEALWAVVRESNNEYAKVYARAGLYLSGEALKTQILYVLTNLGGWRGDRAREVKKVLKEV